MRKLERDLQIAQRNTEVHHNIFHLTVHPKYHFDCPKVFNQLLSELTPGEEHPEDRRLLHDVSGTCREMQVQTLILDHDVDDDGNDDDDYAGGEN